MAIFTLLTFFGTVTLFFYFSSIFNTIVDIFEFFRIIFNTWHFTKVNFLSSVSHLTVFEVVH